ncbi:MAG: hypothetical protein OHK93_006782, partial [Ramalina farinacea]|nr:hypothetical protein [Ramalina farinacea]
PIPLLWRLRVTLRQQVILTSIFTLAGFVIVVSIVWIIVVPDVTQPDITWGAVNFGIWSTLEPNIAVICACIPSLHPLVTYLRNGVFTHPLFLARTLRSANTNTKTSTNRSAKPKWTGNGPGGEDRGVDELGWEPGGWTGGV